MADTLVSAIQIRSALLQTFHTKITDASITGDDAIKFQSAIDMIEVSGDFEKAIVDLGIQFRDKLENEYTQIFNTKLAEIDELQNGLLTLPPFWHYSASKNRLIERSSSKFFFISGSSDWLSVWFTDNKGLTWRKVLGFKAPSSVDARKLDNFASFDIIQDGSNFRVAWIKGHVVKTALIQDGSYIEETSLTSDDNKSSGLRMEINSIGDIVIFFSQTDGSYYVGTYVSRVGNAWRPAVNITPRAGNYTDKLSLGRILVIGDKWYAHYTNMTDRHYIVEVYFNAESNGLSHRINNEGSKNVDNAWLFLYINLDGIPTILIRSTNYYPMTMTVASSLGAYIQMTGLASSRAVTYPDVMLEDGVFVNNEFYTKDGGNTLFPSVYLPYSAVSNPESQALILVARDSNLYNVQLVDVTKLVKRDAVLKGL